MAIEIVKGCLLGALDKGEVSVIAHVVNCQGVMGSGIAKSIKDKYPEVFTIYSDFVRVLTRVNEGDTSQLLGSNQLISVTDDTPDKLVVNLFAQDNYGAGKRHLNYGALSVALVDVKRKLKDIYWRDPYTIGFPYKMGSDRAGGDFEIVVEMIDFHFKDQQVKIYQLGD